MDFFMHLPRLPNGQLDIDKLNQPPQGDRSAEGFQWNPTLGYHVDIGEAYWEGKMLTYVKLKQIQAICGAYDVEVDVDKMKHWTVSQAKDYFMAGGA